MLQITNLNVYFNRGTPNEVHAIRDLSLTVDDQSMVMIVGSNGAGKSTLASTIAGSVLPSSGSVTIDGREVTHQPNYRRAVHISRVFADPLAGTVGDMSLEDNFAMALSRGRGRRTLGRAKTRASRQQIHQAVAELGLGLENRLKEDVGKLSSGQRQALTLAMACYGNPKVLILDEHLSALDPVTRQRLTELTVQSAQRAGCISVMITHSMTDAVDLGDRLLVMNHGSIEADFSGDAKKELTVPALVEKITSSGVELSDRTLLEHHD